ncbi:hypothetical protein J2S49_001398 [Arcanobacterium wilhelmae]|uniref:SPW repeat-containing protein n=1 Tax=Arcanobacterium wilhelmae TaxID=1803177 RepID=A0ABT9NC86_9ACTO|nr:hypothetical protein [Arcanobacterium wilhelmae]MDP9801322.1 hypothetical protein [Arcanobacterium wilhelmae]WFN90662.1 hypothetical protein P8A24_02045 [Arcanobacterium wilhelmae]
MKFLIGALLGAFTGGVGVIVHAGTLAAPWAGPLIAFLLVSSGAWVIAERSGVAGWIGYALGAWGVTVWLLLAPPANDIYNSLTPGLSATWMLLAAVSTIVGLIIAKLFDKKGEKNAQIHAPERVERG